MIDFYNRLFNSKKEELETQILLKNIRKQGLKDFGRIGFPNIKMEKWKNFNTKAFLKNQYEICFEDKDNKLDFFSKINGLESPDTIVFHNGHCSYNMQLDEYKNGVIFGSIKAAAAKYPELVLRYFNKANKQNLNGFNALNSAFVQDGFFLFVPKNTNIDFPVLVTNSYDDDQYHMANSRNIVILEQNSNCEIVQIESSTSYCNTFSNNITELFIGENSTLSLNKLQKYSGKSIDIESTFAIQEKKSTFHNNITIIGGNKLRNDVHIKLNGKNCFADVNGAFVLDDMNEVDNNVYIDHAKADCDSNQNFRGVLDDKAKGAFTGYVLVRQDSQRTNAYQSNKNIVLSDDASMSTNPFLEIYADDVKCSHGASVGNLDANAMLYLQTRGIQKDKAKELLLSAFVLEALKGVKNTKFKEIVSKEIENKILKV